MEHVKTARRRHPGLTIERLGLGQAAGPVVDNRILDEQLKFRRLHGLQCDIGPQTHLLKENRTQAGAARADQCSTTC